MQTIKLSSKGQLVLPRKVRSSRRWGPGTEFAVVETEAGVLLTPVAPVSPFAPTHLADVFGSAGYSGPTVSLREMEVAIADEAGRRHGR